MINNLFRGIIVAVVGVLLISLSESAMPFLVRLLGAVFFLPALFSFANLYVKRRNVATFPMYMMFVINAGSVVLGILLMLFPVAFLEFFVILLALALLCFSLFQLFVVLSLFVSHRTGGGLLIMPLLLTVASVIVLFNPFDVISTASIVFGICLLASGVSDIVISMFGRKYSTTDLQKM